MGKSVPVLKDVHDPRGVERVGGDPPDGGGHVEGGVARHGVPKLAERGLLGRIVVVIRIVHQIL